ncbi:hypothetical protein HPB50_009323 [Hyalomma asiaticum]|uniref:Uncharacterized protein n=1 Tax=Hyalomma asiaticum TaxID=266040 RepID=A0ACB7SP01_HYAAI|nr:hypothetical protein HPB50_009323 [Hyalomma asiaticum]
MKRFTLNARHMAVSQSAENIAQMLLETCAEWKIPDGCRKYIVTDNGRNIRATVRRLPWTERACFAHTLQLAIHDAISNTPSIDRLCKKARHIVGHYKHSSSAQKRLDEYQKKMGKDPLCLVQDVDTRWNSQYLMLSRLLDLKEVVSVELATSSSSIDAKTGYESLLDTAKASVKRLKTLRHPNVLQYVDSLEAEKVVYLVTEYVEPLVMHLEAQKKGEEMKLGASCGLYQVTKGLGFLTGDCDLSHNNICMSSIYVNRAGEWKIGGLEYMCLVTESPPRKSLPALDVYMPLELKDSSTSHRRHSPKWTKFNWGLGCLMWEVFNGPWLKPSCLESPGKIPKALTPAFDQLTNSTVSSRPSPADVFTRFRSTGGFFKNSFVDTMLFIEEIQIKDSTEKNRFFTGLTSVMDNFPSNVCKYKILLQLINAFEFRDVGSAVLTPLFKIRKLLDAEEFKKKIVPCVVKLFSSKERAMRACLL